MMNSKRKYGWTPQGPDDRDFIFSVSRRFLATLPTAVDMRDQCPDVYDQGRLGSCVANATGAAHEFDQIKQKRDKPFTPSRLFIYRGAREMEGTVKQDCGCMIRDAVKYVANQGVCAETTWPYIPEKFTLKPSAKAFKEASLNQALQYEAVPQDIDQLRGCLASGFPFVFGFSVFKSFESPLVAKTGKAYLPGKGDVPVGGHAVMAVGYRDRDKRFIVRNSWGSTWGQKGYFTLPYAYLTNPMLASDFWKITLVEMGG